jgi:pimeloyl-ACP methyl ester carboxylesterase
VTKAPCPAVVFLHGSGALNRYSFGPLPDFFLSRGCAVLIYDKRGTGGSNGKFDWATLEDLASDGRSAVEFLKREEGIDARKIGLCGSSQGGFLAAAVASANPNVAFMVNYCGMFVPVWEQESYRAEAEMRADGLAEADIAEGLAFTKKEFAVAQTGQGWEQLASSGSKDKKWWDYVTKASSLKELQFYWRTLYSYDPSIPLSKVACPVLALLGELDTSTPVPRTIVNMQHALEAAGNANFTKVVFPKAGHGLIETTRGANSEIPSAKRLAPGLFQSMTEWLRRQGII